MKAYSLDPTDNLISVWRSRSQ